MSDTQQPFASVDQYMDSRRDRLVLRHLTNNISVLARKHGVDMGAEIAS